MIYCAWATCQKSKQRQCVNQEGAKVMGRTTIDDKIKKLYEKVPDKWLRRNHRAYNYVCAINLTIVLYIANKLQQHMIERCYRELETIQKQDDGLEFIELSIDLLNYFSSEIVEISANEK
jgi:hypothetical protein